MARYEKKSLSEVILLLGLCGALLGCIHQPASIKVKEKASDTEKQRAVKTPGNVSAPPPVRTEPVEIICANEFSTTSAPPPGATEISDAADIIDAKSGNYVLLEARLYSRTTGVHKVDLAGAVEIKIERLSEESTKITSRLLCANIGSSGSGMSVRFEENVIDSFAERDGAFSIRRILKTEISEAVSKDANNDPRVAGKITATGVDHVIVDAIDELGRKETRLFSLGDPLFLAAQQKLKRKDSEKLSQKIYRISDKVIEVRMDRTSALGSGSQKTSSIAVRYELAPDLTND